MNSYSSHSTLGSSLGPEESALVMQSLGYAQGLAKQFHVSRMRAAKPHTVELGDLESAAYLGLCDAAKRFDSARGQNFQTYSYLRVRGEMWDLLRRDGGMSRYQFRQIMDQTASHARSEAEAAVESAQEDDADTEKEEQEERRTLPYALAFSAHDLVSYSSVFAEYGLELSLNTENGTVDLTYVNDPTPEDRSGLRSLRSYVQVLLQELPARERRVLELRYYENLTLEEVAERMGAISKSLASRLHAKALDALRTAIIRDHGRCQKKIDNALEKDCVEDQREEFFARAA